MFSNQSGVSLLEILITTLVLGVGLLGVAALQVSSIGSNQEGFFATQATAIAEDYASRMRTSKYSTLMPTKQTTEAEKEQAYKDYLTAYNNGTSTNPFECASQAVCRSGTACSISELADFDRSEICKAAEATLPDGMVRVISNAGIKLGIVVEWASAVGRKDIGSETIVNENCQALIGKEDRNCVIVELIP